MTRLAILTMIFGAMAPALAYADWDYAHWGMSPDQLVQASGGAVTLLPPNKRKTHAAPFSSVTMAQGRYSEGLLKLQTSFSFDAKTGGLSCIVFTGAESQAEPMKQSFLRRYGPTEKTNSVAGVMDTFEWDKPGDAIGLTLMKGSEPFATQCKPGTIPPIE